MLHIDIWGPCSPISMNGDRYFLTIVDDHTCFTWLFLMHTNFEARKIFIDFVQYVATQFQKKHKMHKN